MPIVTPYQNSLRFASTFDAGTGTGATCFVRAGQFVHNGSLIGGNASLLRDPPRLLFVSSIWHSISYPFTESWHWPPVTSKRRGLPKASHPHEFWSSIRRGNAQLLAEGPPSFSRSMLNIFLLLLQQLKFVPIKVNQAVPLHPCKLSG